VSPSEKMNFENIWVFIPAFNSAKTLEKTLGDIPSEIQNVVVVDDGSVDETSKIAKTHKVNLIRHEKNRGYGATQKSGYKFAIDNGAEVVIMLHADYQYDSRVTLLMAELISLGNCDIVLGNRIRTRREALQGGMPVWRYLINRISTFFENVLLGQNLGDFHSGLRAYSRKALNTIKFESNSDNFSFDQEFLVQACALNLRIGDIPIPVRYESSSSSISVRQTIRYGNGALLILAKYVLHRLKILRNPRFTSKLS
jgi:glycosyltransferase involved in cell wall biosynthesis